MKTPKKPRRMGAGRVYRRKARGHELPTWWIAFFTKDAHGRPREVRMSTKTTDHDEAQRQLKIRQGLAAAGTLKPVDVDRTTVRDLLGLLVLDYKREGQVVPPGHVEALTAALGSTRAADLKRVHLDALVDTWREQGATWPDRPCPWCRRRQCTQPAHERPRPLSVGTCNRIMATLRRAFTLGREKLDLESFLTFPQFTEKKNPHPIPPDVLADLFAAMEDEPEARVKFLRFLLVAGPRKGQVLDTLASQFTPATGKMHWTDEDTKTDCPHIVTYGDEAREILDWFVAHRDPACAYLFQEEGKRLTKDKLDGTWARACKRAGVPVGRSGGGYVIHHLRHTFVSDAHDAGLAAGVIMAHTGHLREPTMLHYLRVSGTAQQRAQETLGAYRREQAEQVKAQARSVPRLVGRRAVSGEHR